MYIQYIATLCYSDLYLNTKYKDSADFVVCSCILWFTPVIVQYKYPVYNTWISEQRMCRYLLSLIFNNYTQQLQVVNSFRFNEMQLGLNHQTFSETILCRVLSEYLDCCGLLMFRQQKKYMLQLHLSASSRLRCLRARAQLEPVAS